MRIMAAWAFPAWVVFSFKFLIANREVRSVVGGTLGPLRRILRGLCMGGPASPFLWALGYDPVLHSLKAMTGSRCPTFVDDLAALVRGAKAMARVQFIRALGKAAGLAITPHSCSDLSATRGLLDLTRLLAPLPVKVHPDPEQGVDACRIEGLPLPSGRSS